MDLKQFFEGLGYDITEKINWDENIRNWESWYKGKVNSFHNYYIYNGSAKVELTKKSLQGAKKVAEDWADLLFNEKVFINLKTENDTQKLYDILKTNKGSVLINQAIEKTFALGTGAFVISVQDLLFDEENNLLDVTEAKAKIQFVDASKIYPLSWDNTGIKECAFVTYKVEKGINYAYISMHVLENEKYIIKNYKFKVESKNNLSPVNDEDGFIADFDTKSNIPWFAILKPNICNNIDTDSPFGISIYANAIDTLKCLDNAYDGMDNEVNLGRRRMFISEEMMTYDGGNEQLTFDPDDISIYRLPKGFNKDAMITHSDPSLRTSEYKDAVNFQLNILSSKVGFGQERYQFDGKAIQTATGVISENSDMYRTIKKHEITLEDCLDVMIQGLSYATSTFTGEGFKAEEIKIEFDDSIIEDKGAEQVRAQSEVNSGTRSKHSYMKNIRCLTDDEIQTEFGLMQEEKGNTQEDFPSFE